MCTRILLIAFVLVTTSAPSTMQLSAAPQPRASANELVARTLEPMAGEWEGMYEARTDTESPHQRKVALSIKTSAQGRACEIKMQFLDQHDRPSAAFQFKHELNSAGNRIRTTDDPAVGGTVTDGVVTESSHDVDRGRWRVAFRANQAGGTNFTTCRWTREGEKLSINRDDIATGADGTSSRRMSDLTLRLRASKAHEPNKTSSEK